MAAEAQKLISLSLTKIAKSRTQRGGVSLHRNLLVATVLQRARFVFMEEAYHMVQRQSFDSEESTNMCEEQQQGYNNPLTFDVCGHIASEVVVDGDDNSAESDSQLYIVQESNKENHSPSLPSESLPVILSNTSYSELDSRLRDDSVILREKLETNISSQIPLSTPCEVSVPRTYSSLNTASSLKRRRVVVAEWETEEAILSILPKKAKREDDVYDECEESALFEEIVTTLPATHSSTEDSEENEVTSMEIDRITSLVSIFSFGGLTSGGNSEMFSGGVVVGSSTDTVGKLTRSVSTPDLCSAQAKEGGGVDVMQRPFLAMTV